MLQPARISLIVLIACCCCCAATIAAQHLPLRESLNEIDSDESDAARADVKTRRVRARPNDDAGEDVPDFDLLRITSGKRRDAEHIPEGSSRVCLQTTMRIKS